VAHSNRDAEGNADLRVPGDHQKIIRAELEGGV